MTETEEAKPNFIAVFWDVENCAPPRGTKGADIVENLRATLQDFGVIRQIYAYAELRLIPDGLRMELQRLCTVIFVRRDGFSLMSLSRRRSPCPDA